MMNRKVLDAFAVIGAVATVLSVGVAWYYGREALRSPGVAVQGVDELIDSQDEQAAVSREIRDAVTPVDEIAALSSRGYSIDGPSFFRALRAGDKTSLDLFCAADISPLKVYISNFDVKDLSAEVVRTLRNCSYITIEELCSLPIGDTGDWGGRPGMKYDEETTVALCGRSAYRDAYQRWERAAAAYDERLVVACQERLDQFAEEHEKWGGHSASAMSDQMYLSNTEFGRDCARVGVPM